MFFGGVRSVIMICVANVKALKRHNVHLVIYFSTNNSISIPTIDAIYAIKLSLKRVGIANVILTYASNAIINDFYV